MMLEKFLWIDIDFKKSKGVTIVLASLAILVVAILIALAEVPTLLKKKMIKECILFSLLLIIGTSLSLAKAQGVQLPNPVDWIVAVMQPVADWIDNILK